MTLKDAIIGLFLGIGVVICEMIEYICKGFWAGIGLWLAWKAFQ